MEQHGQETHSCSIPILKPSDIDWPIALQTGKVNGFKLTKLMLEQRLREKNMWKSGYGRRKKDFLIEQVKKTL